MTPWHCPKCGPDAPETFPEVFARYDCKMMLVEVELECPECRFREYAYIGPNSLGERLGVTG